MHCESMEAAGLKKAATRPLSKSKKSVANEKPEEISPGDLRANKGYVYLKDDYIGRFR